MTAQLRAHWCMWCRYVCGDAKHMARDVSHALTKIAMQYGGMTEQNAVNWFKDLRKRNRYCEDVWS